MFVYLLFGLQIHVDFILQYGAFLFLQFNPKRAESVSVFSSSSSSSFSAIL